MLTEVRGGVRLAVHIHPGAKRNAVVGVHGDALKIAVAAPPVDGKANDAIGGLIADLFDIPSRAVAVVAGHSSRRKIVQIEGVSLPEAQRCLASRLASLSKQA
jgi:uncharacterized protein (TIGR00251 family)